MSLGRQGRNYLLLGGLQWLVDCTVMMALSHAGMPVEPANIAGRISGAVLGYWLNGRITFASEHNTLGRTQFMRFVAMWLCTTAISTSALGVIDNLAGLKWAWVTKPGLELVLGALGFVISRHWVYRR